MSGAVRFQADPLAGDGHRGLSQRLNKELVRASAHGVSAGMVSELAGGKFGAAFAGGFSGSMMAHLGPQHQSFSLTLVQAAATGGAASKVAGGSFTNAAVTSAFQVMFNKAMHSFREVTVEAAQRLRALQAEDPDNSEWGTVIGVNQKGEHAYAPPVRGIDQDDNPYSVDPSRAQLPDGFESTGHYLHSHPDDFRGRFGAIKNGQPHKLIITYFSREDILWAASRQVNLWVITPAGHLGRFIPAPYPDNLQELGYRRPIDYQITHGTIRGIYLK